MADVHPSTLKAGDVTAVGLWLLAALQCCNKGWRTDLAISISHQSRPANTSVVSLMPIVNARVERYKTKT